MTHKCIVCKKNREDHTLEEAQRCFYINQLSSDDHEEVN